MQQRRKLQRQRLSLTALAVPMAVAILVSFPVAASASIGVGIQAGPVRLGGVAEPGRTYDLPPVYVVDTGTEPESVRLVVKRLSHGPGRDVPPSWIQVSGPDVKLTAHQSARIPVQLVVPSDAKPGPYLSDVVVHGSAGLSAGQATLAVAAATKLQFTVGDDPAPAGLLSNLTASLAWVAALLALIVAAVLVIRRSGWRIRLERGPHGPDAVDHEGGPGGAF
jgi:hypothetical protein